MSDFSNIENENNKKTNGYFESDKGKDIVDASFIQNKLDKIIKEENKKFSEKKNKIVEEAAVALDGAFSSEPEGIKAEDATNTKWGKAAGVDGLKKSEWTPSKSLQEEMMKTIKSESEEIYLDQIEGDDFMEAHKNKRKLVSFTISTDAKEKLSEMSKNRGMNKSRLIEKLINEHYNKENKFKETFANSAGPINVDMLELANKVATIIKSENLI